MPTVARASTIVSGFSTLPDDAECGVDTYGPMWTRGARPCASNRTVTWLGAVTWPGTTSANSSSRLCGFCTMPVTRRAVPPLRQRSPTLRWKAAATPLVTATWPGPAG